MKMLKKFILSLVMVFMAISILPATTHAGYKIDRVAKLNAGEGHYICYYNEYDSDLGYNVQKIAELSEVALFVIDEGDGYRYELEAPEIDVITIDEIPVREGYEFLGYKKGDDYYQSLYGVDFADGDTFEVIWGQLISSVTVDGNGGKFLAGKYDADTDKNIEEKVSEIIVNFYRVGDEVECRAAKEGFEWVDQFPEKIGSDFLGFSTSADGKEVFALEDTPINVDKIYAIYNEPLRSFTAHANGGEFVTHKYIPETDKDETGSLETIIIDVFEDSEGNKYNRTRRSEEYDYVEEATREGYRFVGYATKANSEEGSYNIESLPESVKDLYAVYKKATKVTLNPNGGQFDWPDMNGSYTDPRVEDLLVGERLSDYGVNKEGEYFIGWYIEADGGRRVNEVPEEAITLYARYSQDPIFILNYNLPEDANVGFVPFENAKLSQLRNGVQLPTVTSDKGTFMNWSYDVEDYSLRFSTENNVLKIEEVGDKIDNYVIELTPNFKRTVEENNERLVEESGVVVIDIKDNDELAETYVENNIGKTLVLRYKEAIMIIPKDEISAIPAPKKDVVESSINGSNINLAGNINDYVDYSDYANTGDFVLLLVNAIDETATYYLDENYLSFINNSKLTAGYNVDDARFLNLSLGYLNFGNSSNQHLSMGNIELEEGKKLAFEINIEGKFKQLADNYTRSYKLLHKRHDGSVEEITTTKNSYGNYIKVNGNIITVYVDETSPFMLMYKDSAKTVPVYSVPDTATK